MSGRIVADDGLVVSQSDDFTFLHDHGTDRHFAVLLGLSRPLPALSFEFTTIQRDVAFACLERLASLGDYRFDLALGESQEFSLPAPVDARAKVLKLGREITIQFGGQRKGVNTIGDAAALQIEGVTVIVNTKRSQCHSLDCFTKLGVDPSTKKVVVVKSMQHFHAAYAPIASEVVYVAAPGALVPDWSLLPYKKADKTQWPFVADPHS